MQRWMSCRTSQTAPRRTRTPPSAVPPVERHSSFGPHEVCRGGVGPGGQPGRWLSRGSAASTPTTSSAPGCGALAGRRVGEPFERVGGAHANLRLHALCCACAAVLHSGQARAALPELSRRARGDDAAPVREASDMLIQRTPGAAAVGTVLRGTGRC